MSHPKRIRFTVTTLAVITFFGMGIFLGRGWENKVSAETETFEDLKVFSEVLSVLQKDYVEPVKSKDLIYGAIKGMVNTLDAHSAFMPPDVYKEVQVDTRGEFGGLGLQVGVKDNRLVVIAPIEGTPADQAGVKAGDWILKVDDQTTKDMNLMDAVNKMRGPKGSKVVITILREGVKDPLTFNIVRDIIRIQSVKSKIIDPDIGYIRISQFQEQTAKDLAMAYSKLKEGNIHSLILDLRNNPGGLLSSAVEVSEQFIESGKLIVSIKGRDAKKDDYFAGGNGPTIDVPMIVLVNEGSASASEIVSGALQDWGRAIILGTQTFGKGSVQTILPLSDGSALRLTTAKYYTPKGRSIQNTGIDPDIVVKPAFVREAKNAPIIRERDLERHLENETLTQSTKSDAINSSSKETPEQGQEPVVSTGKGKEDEDVQLNKAVDLLKTWKIFKEHMPQSPLQQRAG
jgi:carboxyl-terminal processing protease